MSNRTLQNRVNQLLYRIRTSPNAVLQYSHDKKDLVVWYWPVNERGERVTPSDFEAHRRSHNVLGPCCLCPLEFETTNAFKESVVFVVGHGRYTGEYVAGCADGRCNYFGTELFMERLYGREGTLVRQYPLRDVNEEAPPTVRNLLDDEAEVARYQEKKRKRNARDDGDLLRGIRKCAPPALGPKDVVDRLFRLDSIMRPGLTRAEFLELFAGCTVCGLVMTRRTFQSHECVVPEDPEIVDLTGEYDE